MTQAIVWLRDPLAVSGNAAVQVLICTVGHVDDHVVVASLQGGGALQVRPSATLLAENADDYLWVISGVADQADIRIPA